MAKTDKPSTISLRTSWRRARRFIDRSTSRFCSCTAMSTRVRRRLLARETLRNALEALKSRGAGSHGREQATLHEFSNGLEPGQALLTQFLDALLDERVVGLCRADPIAGRSRGLLKRRTQLQKLVEERTLIRGVGLSDCGGRLGQLSFAPCDFGLHLARDGQGQERHHPVGLDLKKPLHETTCLVLAQMTIMDEDARETIGMDPAIREGHGRPTRHDAADDRLTHKMPREVLGRRGRSR